MRYLACRRMDGTPSVLAEGVCEVHDMLCAASWLLTQVLTILAAVVRHGQGFSTSKRNMHHVACSYYVHIIY